MGIVEELEGAIDIVEIVGKYTKLKKSGANYKAVCPFPGHNEKTPSFMVSPAKQLAYCFGCHKGGGALKFIMDIENTEFKDALEILAGFAGRKLEGYDNKAEAIKKNIYSLYKDATNYYKSALKKYPEIKKYLFDRGLNDEDIEKFQFGYADSGVELYNYLKAKGYDDNQITDSNIFVNIKTRKDKFINRIIFPIQNLRGDIIAFTARIVGNGEPKYLNSPASKLYDKSTVLYGLYNAKSEIVKKDFIIITEGQMDVISMHSAGFINTVAVSGTALTEKHLGSIKRLTHKLFICFDGDSAGQKAINLSLEIIKNKGFEVKIIMLPDGKDPDDILKSGIDFNEYIKKAETPIGYYITKSNFKLSSIEDKKNLLNTLLDILKSYSDPVEQDSYLKEIAQKLNLRDSIIYDAYNKLKRGIKSIKTDKIKKDNLSSWDIAIGNILLNNSRIEYIKENIIFKDDIFPDLTKILENPKNIESFPLDKKDRYKAISMQIEDEESIKTEEIINQGLEKLIKGINKDSYKLINERLKNDMNNGDNEAFKKYSELLVIAKKHGLK